MLLRHYEVLIIVSNGYPSVRGRLPTRYSPVRRCPSKESAEASSSEFSLDLHVLGTPPAFILSQDQTLNKWYLLSPQAVQINPVSKWRLSRLDSFPNHYCLLEIVQGHPIYFLLDFSSLCTSFVSYTDLEQDLHHYMMCLVHDRFYTMKFSRFLLFSTEQLNYFTCRRISSQALFWSFLRKIRMAIKETFEAVLMKH